MSPHLLLVGGEDHDLRIPFVHALQQRGFRVTAAGTGNPAAFTKAGIEYCSYRLDRSVSPLADRATVDREVRRVLEQGRAARGHLFNLGHGVLPETDPGVLTHVVELVHEYSVREAA